MPRSSPRVTAAASSDAAGDIVLQAPEAQQLFDLVAVLSVLPPAPDARQDVYLDAAARCFEQLGLAHASIQDVAAQAGVARSTVYRAVGNLEQVVQQLALRDTHRFFAALPEMIVGHGGAEAIIDVLATFIDGARSHPLLRKDVQERPGGVDATLQRYLPGFLAAEAAMIAPLLEAAMQLGYIARRDAGVLADWIARIGLSLIIIPPDGDLRAYLGEMLGPTLSMPPDARH